MRNNRPSSRIIVFLFPLPVGLFCFSFFFLTCNILMAFIDGFSFPFLSYSVRRNFFLHVHERCVGETIARFLAQTQTQVRNTKKLDKTQQLKTAMFYFVGSRRSVRVSSCSTTRDVACAQCSRTDSSSGIRAPLLLLASPRPARLD